LNEIAPPRQLRRWAAYVFYRVIKLLTMPSCLNIALLTIIITAICAVSCRTVTTGQQSNQSPQDVRFASGQSALRIPFELSGNNIWLRGRVNESESLWFTIDTGASFSLINIRRAQELGLQLESGHRTAGAGGSIESTRVAGITFRLPGVDIFNQTIAALSLDSLEPVEGHDFDVLLGYHFFSNFVVEIDYAARIINLYDPQSYEYHGSGEIIPMALKENRHPYIRARIVQPGREPIEGEFEIDTGSGQTLILQSGFIAEHRLLRSGQRVIQAQGRGVGGAVPLPISRITSFQLGRFAIENPLTVFAQSGAGRFAEDGADGNIGNGILRRFKVIFDYTRGRMILEPNENFSEPSEYDMSGISLIAERPGFDVIRVERVLENSPAAEVGIKPQDIIVAANSRPAAEIGLSGLREMFRLEGQEYRLSIKRGGELLLINLRTRRLI